MNASDVGANVHTDVTSEQGISTDPLSNDTEGIMFGDDQETFIDFVFSHLTININSDDNDAPMTKGWFKKPNDKLDSILESSNQSSSSKWDYKLTSHKAIMEMLTSTNAKVLKEATKVIQALGKKISKTNAKVKKLHQEVKDFMMDFRTSSHNNTTSMNKVIE